MSILLTRTDRAEIPEASEPRASVPPWEPVLRAAAISALVATAVITAAQIGQRYQQDRLAGRFLAGLLLVQALLVVAVTARSRRLDRLTIGLSLATVASWAITRTIGAPVGPRAWQAQPVGVADLLATLLELVTVAVLVPLAWPAARWPARGALLVIVAGTCAGASAFALHPAPGVTTGLGVVPAAGAHQHGSDRTDAQLPPPTPSGQFSVADSRKAALCADRLSGRTLPAVAATEQTITAQGQCFDRAEIVLPANRDVVLHLVNREPATDPTGAHALSIYAFSDLPEAHYPLVLGTPAPPGTTVDVKFRTPGPGSYFFQCDVHRWMRGVVVVR